MRWLLLALLIMACAPIEAENSLTEEMATFAGGCFWCIEAAFQEEEGVLDAVSGYAGGIEENAAYKKVSSGTTDHLEAVQVTYDPAVITYEKLLDIFWRHTDPTDDGGQFVDRGPQYRTAIFYHTEEQQQEAEASKVKTGKELEKPIVTRILPFSTFFPAETEHQDYYQKRIGSYTRYKDNSGREKLDELWPDLKEKLTPLQYDVTQSCATEPAFDNEYWDEKRDGIYVDVVSGDALFSSKDKFESGSGWPSFTKPIDDESVETEEDNSLGMKRTALKSADAGSHLGHVFNDGPGPTGERYCINSASLRFILKEDLEKEGYGEYLMLFE